MFPRPEPTIDDEAFWDACGRHELVIQGCADCGELRHPPTPTCHECRSFDVEWHEVPGTGEVFTWTTTRYAAGPGYEDHLPYSVAVIRLDGTGEQDVLVVSHLVNVDPDDVEFGLPVTVVWEEVGEGITLPLFRPAG